MKGIRLCASITLFFVLLLSCRYEAVTDGSLRRSKIHAEAKYLTAILEINTPGYFLNNGLPTGYHFEMLRSYATSKGVQLRIIPFTSIENATGYLKSGKADILAVENVNINDNNIQRTIPHWKVNFATISFSRKAMNKNDIVYVPNNAFDNESLKALICKYPNIVLFDGLNIGLLVEHLLTDIHAFIIVQSSIAAAVKIKYKTISISHLKENSSSSWYVVKSSKILYDLNSWIATNRNTSSHPSFYSSFYQNYKVNSCLSAGVSLQADFKLSNYDSEVKGYSSKIGWDWLLVSALIYQESKFMPHVESGKGAKGLMQVMPATAKLFGFHASHSSNTNIYIGTRLLAKLSRVFSNYPIAVEERNKFVLAAYNGGFTHVLNAMNLTFRNGRNPYSWDEVSMFLRVKRNSNNFKMRKVTAYNVSNNNETTRFVFEVLERYNNYKALTLN